MLCDDYDQEIQRYDSFCYEYYCRLRQRNAALYRSLYENWYITNNSYPTHYGCIRDINFSSEFSNSERSSSPIAQSSEERNESNEYSSVKGAESNERPDIDFHYYDSYYYGFYDTMRRINPTMYAILYAKWCASHQLLSDDVHRNQIPYNITPGESSHLVRQRLPKDFITAHCDTDGSEILSSNSSAPPESKQQENVDRSNFEEYGQITLGYGHCENDRESTTEVHINGGVAGEMVIPKELLLNRGVGEMLVPKFYEPADTELRQEIKVISPELQTVPNKRTNKPDLPEKKQEKSWINTLLTKLNFSRAEAHLPDDDCPTIIWDSDRKQWIDTATNENSNPGNLLLPPKSSGVAPSGTDNVYRLKKSRDIRSKYVDVLQTSKQFSDVILGFNNSSEENSCV